MKTVTAMAFGFLALVLVTLPLAAQDDPPAGQPRMREAGFVVGVEDVLRIVVWSQKDLTLTVKVRPDGKITVPLVNDIEVVGLKPEQIAEQITTSLREYVRDPIVTVIVEEINSFRVYFLGEVATQGAIQLYRPTRVLQAVAMAGGVTEFSKKEITLLREISGIETRIQVNYKRLLAGENTEDNIQLMPGDTLLVR